MSMFSFLLALLMSSIFAAEPSPADENEAEYINKNLITAPNKARALENEDQSILKRHYPFYFAYGHPTTKLQMSFKALLMRKAPIYFGYTQLMFWQLNAKSKPFQDLTYNPELFYKFSFDPDSTLQSIDFGGIAHNSNGKRDDDSRSFNKSYVRFNFQYQLSLWILRISPELAYLYDFDETNSDIREYIGPLTMTVSFIQLFKGWIDKSEFSIQYISAGRYAERWERGGTQVSFSFRLGGMHFVPAFYLQYYRGYAETLLNYHQNVNVFRGGIIF